MQALLDFCLNWIFPRQCVLCSKSGALLCRRCYQLIQFYPPFKPNQLQAGQSIDSVKILAHYQPPIKNLIHTLKYQRVEGAAKSIAELMHIHLDLPPADFICCVPSSKLRISNRGFNQSRLIAEELSGLIRAKFIPILTKVRNTARQASLKNPGKRLNNLNTAFQLAGSTKIVSNKSILLVDDVISTGATLNECAQILKKAGVSQVTAVAAARS